MRRLKQILKWVGLLVLALIVLGAAYQQIGSLIDDNAVPPPGRMIAVSGHRVHLLCMGSGRRTIVLDAGLGGGTFEWHRLQPALARDATVCAFDRPGLGASDTVAHAYDAVTAADELHALAGAAHIARPFTYVGHSLGANFAQVYAARYPGDVNALVLIEPGVPEDMLEDFHGSRAEALAMPATCDAVCGTAWVMSALGIPRLIVTYVQTGATNLGDAPVALAQYRAGAARTSAAGVSLAYLRALPKIAWQVRDAKLPRTVPVLVLASEIAPPPDAGESPADMVRWRQRQLAYFATLAGASAGGEGPITIKGATHTSMVMSKPAARTTAAIAAFLAKRTP